MSATNGNRPPIDPELISAFYDGETTPEQRAAVEASMDQTSDTLQTLDDYDQLSQSLRQLHQTSTAPDLTASVMAQIQASRPAALASSPGVRRPGRLFAVVAGLTGLAAAVTLLLWPPFDARQDNALAVNDQVVPNEAAVPEMGLAADAPPAARASATAPAPAPMAMAATAELEADTESLLAAMTRKGPPVEVGEVYGYLDRNKDELTWVSVTVADIREAGDKVQVLLARNGMASSQSPASAPAQNPDSDNLITFLVESNWEQMEAVIVELTDAAYVDSLVVNAPDDENVPQVLQGYAIKRSEKPTEKENRSARLLKKQVQDRQPPVADRGSRSDGAAPEEGVQLQLLVREADLKRFAERRHAAATADTPTDAVSPETAKDGVLRSEFGRPLASPRARAVIVIHPLDE